MTFLIDDIKRTQAEILGLIYNDEKLSLNARCYTMEAIDSIIKQTQLIAGNLVSLPKESAERINLCDTLVNNYNDILVN